MEIMVIRPSPKWKELVQRPRKIISGMGINRLK
jgi:hypothetical protein